MMTKFTNIQRLDMHTGEVRQYGSRMEAAEVLGLSHSTVSTAVKGNRVVLRKYLFRVESDKDWVIPKPNTRDLRDIYIKNLETGEVSIYANVYEIVCHLNVSYSTVRSILSRSAKRTNVLKDKYVLKYSDEDFPVPFHKAVSGRAIAVKVLDTIKNKVRRFDTIAEAAIYCGVRHNVIQNRLSGYTEQSVLIAGRYLAKYNWDDSGWLEPKDAKWYRNRYIVLKNLKTGAEETYMGVAKLVQILNVGKTTIYKALNKIEEKPVIGDFEFLDSYIPV